MSKMFLGAQGMGGLCREGWERHQDLEEEPLPKVDSVLT